MNFAELRDRVIDEAKNIWNKIQDSSLYQHLIEKYEDLPSSQQNLAKVGGAILTVLFLVGPPINTLLDANQAIDDFERKRDLTRELLRVMRDAGSVPQIPQGIDINSLQSTLQMDMENRRLLPEQIYAIQVTNDLSSLIPEKLSTGSLSVSLKDLNLRQILDVSYKMSSISPTIKMTDLELNASPERPGYFHLNAKLIALKSPEPLIAEPAEDLESSKKRPKRRSNPISDNEASMENGGEE